MVQFFIMLSTLVTVLSVSECGLKTILEIERHEKLKILVRTHSVHYLFLKQASVCNGRQNTSVIDKNDKP